MMTCSMPLAIASSTPYWMVGLSTSGSISFGCALVAGRKRVPRPAAGKTALRTFMGMGRAVKSQSQVLQLIAAQLYLLWFGAGDCQRYTLAISPAARTLKRRGHA